MNETIDQIRGLLSQLESDVSPSIAATELRAFTGLELPDIICDVVDLLMPELKPYESALYMHLLRHSVIESSAPYVRTSVRKLRTGVVKSAQSGTVSGASYQSMRTALDGLIEIGAIRQEGDPNRVGTLYRVLLPEEIETCQRRRAKQTARSTITANEREADFYNIRENRLKIYERDNYHCIYCGKQLTRFTATLDHITPVSEGGGNSVDNLKTACLQCNSRKTGRPLGDFLAEKFPTS
ncbi:MAG: HNH endonuclease [Alphaproteobacteria bacterium]